MRPRLGRCRVHRAREGVARIMGDFLVRRQLVQAQQQEAPRQRIRRCGAADPFAQLVGVRLPGERVA